MVSGELTVVSPWRSPSARSPTWRLAALRLGDVLGRAQGLLTQQATFTAAKQELSQQIKTSMEDIQFLSTMLRKGVRQHFGKRSEKQAELGLQPFRGRKAGGKTTPPPEPNPAPTDR